MDEVFYSTGQAARELGVTQAKIRALCETGSIHCVSTTGGQWRIPKGETERLKSEGLPAIPRPLPDAEPATKPQKRSRQAVKLLAEPSEAVVGSTEHVVCLENDVQCIGLQRQKEEALDWFRERENREAQRVAESKEAERRRLEQEQHARSRRAWEEKWIQFALHKIPQTAPSSARLEVSRAVEVLLQGVQRTDQVIRPLVEAAVDHALVPWRRTEQIAQTILAVCDAHSVPWRMKLDTDWKRQLHVAATEAVARLRDSASRAEVESAAQRAIAPIVVSFEHEEACSNMLRNIWHALPGGTLSECEQGKDAVRIALGSIRVGASVREMERARDLALQSIRAEIASRTDRDMRAGLLRHITFRFLGWSQELQKQALHEIDSSFARHRAGTPQRDLEVVRDEIIERYKEMQRFLEAKRRLINDGLSKVRPYLDRLAVDWEFTQSLYSLTQEVSEAIRPILEEELRGDEDLDDVERKVRRLVREHLDV